VRALFIAALIALAASRPAFADASIAGHWKSDVGDNVTIDMQVTPDGYWTSETVQGQEVVRKMSGTYKQTHSDKQTGELVFVPTSASAGSQNVETETDSYALSENGQELRLTSGGDTMVFEKKSP
jgi:hypothetical protein